MSIVVQTTVSAAARDYDWLLDRIGKFSGNRSDLADLGPDFVMLAEKRMNGDIEAKAAEFRMALTATAGASSFELPSNLAELKSLSTATCGTLEYLPPNSFDEKSAGGETGEPRWYTVINRDVYTYPVQTEDTEITCTYRAFIPPLSDSSGTNWLIEDHANCYLAAAMCEVMMYTKNLAELPAWEKKYADAIAEVNKTRWSSIGPMTIRTR